MFIIFAGSHPPSTLRDRVSRNHYSHTKRPGTKINQFGEWGDKSSVRRTIKFLNKLQLPALKTTCHWRQVFVWPERKTLSPSATLWGKRSFQSNWREVGLEDPWNARRQSIGIGWRPLGSCVSWSPLMSEWEVLLYSSPVFWSSINSKTNSISSNESIITHALKQSNMFPNPQSLLVIAPNTPTSPRSPQSTS